MSASYPIRPISEQELPQFAVVGEHAFNSNWPRDGFLELERMLFEPERSLAAFDGEEMIGTAEIISFEMIVPGGEVPAAGVTGVAVLPSHRRRGVLSSLMRQQLADIAAGPEPVAALFASETMIYGRYGYGIATHRLTHRFKRGVVVPVPPGAPRLRIVVPGEGRAAMRSVYETFRVTRPGMMSRSEGYWNAMLADPEWNREGNSPMRCLLAEDESGPRGYALYSTKPDWGPDGLPTGTLSVHEAFATDLPATRALWADLLSRDLISEIIVWTRPVDDPLLYLVSDPRQARPVYRDGLWIRLTDLQAALTRRCYSAPVDVVIEVTDEVLPANAGRWRLQAGGLTDTAKPSCERTTAEPDLLLPVAALGAAYLGGIRLGALAEVGVITEQRAGAAAELSAAMWWDPAPWPATSF